jgi:polyhydroxybutyrate depolymerase
MRAGGSFGAALVALMALTGCAGDDDASAPTTTAVGAVADGATSTTVPTSTTEATSDSEVRDPTTTTVAGSSGCTGSSDARSGEVPIIAAGLQGTYLRHVPEAHDGITPVPVVIDLHGYSSPLSAQELMSGLAAYGMTEGFVTILPQVARPVPRWDTTLDSDDLAFVAGVLDEVERSLCVDPQRAYVAGMSNGAFMTSAVACELADRIAAVAPVAGLRDVEGCAPARPVPVIAFHGTDDQFVAYDGGLGPAVANLPSPDGTGTLGDLVGTAVLPGGGAPVPEMASAWAVRNGCRPEPVEELVAIDVALLRFDCPAGAEVELYRIEGGGHSWPGSVFSASIPDMVGATTESVSATELIWAFFEAHPLPAR